MLVENELLPAQIINHDAPRPVPPAPGIIKEYVEYLASVCAGFHGAASIGRIGPRRAFIRAQVGESDDSGAIIVRKKFRSNPADRRNPPTGSS